MAEPKEWAVMVINTDKPFPELLQELYGPFTKKAAREAMRHLLGQPRSENTVLWAVKLKEISHA